MAGGRAAGVKGKRYEREAATLLTSLTGYEVRRKLGEGRREDEGDLEGIPEDTIQVKAYNDVTRAINEALKKLRHQQNNNGTKFAHAMVRRPGGRWIVVMEPDQWWSLYQEAMRNVERASEGVRESDVRPASNSDTGTGIDQQAPSGDRTLLRGRHRLSAVGRCTSHRGGQ